MSFTAEVKDELSRVPAECEGCTVSTLAALVRICGTLSLSGGRNFRLDVSTETGTVARMVIKYVHNIYNLKTELTVRRSVLHRTHNYLISLPSQPRLQETLVELGVLTPTLGLEQGIKPELIANECCAAAYLRGVFIGGGFIADPTGDFHFEMVTQHEALASDIVDLLARYGVKARMVKRRSEYTVYIKSIEEMLNFLALVGAHNSALEIENVRVVKALRNDVNRQVNAEMANQAKSSAASLKQLKDIALIETHRGLDRLPEALADFCVLRKAHPELNLRELGEAAVPPLSKSAVYHRVRRIEELAREIEKEQKGSPKDTE